MSDTALHSQSSLQSSRRASRRRVIFTFIDQAGMLLVLAVLFIACSALVPNFLSAINLSSLLLAIATVGIVSCTMLFCLASGNFDLSVGSVLAFAGVMAALAMNRTGSIMIGVLAGLLAGAAVGLANGIIVAIFRINPLITTLATMMIVKGLAFICAGTGGQSIAIRDERFYTLGNGALTIPGIAFDIPVPVMICFGCFVLFAFLLERTIFGRNTLAIGGNEEAARLAGISVARTKLLVFVMQGVVAALAGLIVAAQTNVGDPKMGAGFELVVISACVLGGVSLNGGIGRIRFVIAGVLIMGIVENAMNLSNIDSYYQNVVRGGILLAAVMLDKLKQRHA
jgi:L-arabinose transport system permease protein